MQTPSPRTLPALLVAGTPSDKAAAAAGAVTTAAAPAARSSSVTPPAPLYGIVPRAGGKSEARPQPPDCVAQSPRTPGAVSASFIAPGQPEDLAVRAPASSTSADVAGGAPGAARAAQPVADIRVAAAQTSTGDASLATLADFFKNVPACPLFVRETTSPGGGGAAGSSPSELSWCLFDRAVQSGISAFAMMFQMSPETPLLNAEMWRLKALQSRRQAEIATGLAAAATAAAVEADATVAAYEAAAAAEVTAAAAPV